MPEIKLKLRLNLLRLFRYLSAIILNYVNQFRKRSNNRIFVFFMSFYRSLSSINQDYFIIHITLH
ncbi:hypothetical protein [Orientia tsutsugamushi]|uniref:hypothetical protein n=1 Tax=Orientia tsutsugamushi TaxID=784 RepID=UPI003529BC6F